MRTRVAPWDFRGQARPPRHCLWELQKEVCGTRTLTLLFAGWLLAGCHVHAFRRLVRQHPRHVHAFRRLVRRITPCPRLLAIGQVLAPSCPHLLVIGQAVLGARTSSCVAAAVLAPPVRPGSGLAFLCCLGPVDFTCRSAFSASRAPVPPRRRVLLTVAGRPS